MSNNVRRKKNLVIERLNRRLLGESEMDCPKATQDLELNTKHRDSSIKSEHIKYGPLNVDEPGDYWIDLAKHWDTTEEASKKIKELRQYLLHLETETAEKAEIIARTKKIGSQSMLAAQDEIDNLRIELATEKEQNRLIAIRYRETEEQLAEKVKETEDTTSKVMDMLNRTQVAASQSFKGKNLIYCIYVLYDFICNLFYY